MKTILVSRHSFKIGSKKFTIKIAHVLHTELQYKELFLYIAEREGRKLLALRLYVWLLARLDH